MAMIVISTQVYENYGAHTWDGEGDCPQYWKAKGGSDYKVLDVDINGDLQAIVDRAAQRIVCDDDYYRESIISWSVEADDYLSPFERNQLEFEGKILYPEPTIELVD